MHCGLMGVEASVSVMNSEHLHYSRKSSEIEGWRGGEEKK